MVCLCGGSESKAAEWRAELSAQSENQYSDNLRLSTREDENVFGSILEVGGDFGVRVPRTEARLRSWLRAARYPGDSELNSDDAHVELDSTHRMRRSELDFSGAYTRDTTLTSEIEDTGLVQQAIRRERAHIEAAFLHALGPRQRLRLRSAYTDVSYDEPSPELVDYTNKTAGVSFIHDLAPTDELDVRVVAGRFETPEVPSQTDTIALIAGLQHDFSDISMVTLELGVRASEREFQDGGIDKTNRDTGPVFHLGFRQDLRRLSWKIDARKEPRPNGRGFLVVRDEINMEARRSIRRRLTGHARVRLLRNESVEEGSQTGRRFFRLETGLQWALTRQWSLGARYRYSWQRLEGEDEARSNEFTILLRYEGFRKSISR